MLLLIDTRLISLQGRSHTTMSHHQDTTALTTQTTREAALYVAHATQPSINTNKPQGADSELPTCCVPSHVRARHYPNQHRASTKLTEPPRSQANADHRAQDTLLLLLHTKNLQHNSQHLRLRNTTATNTRLRMHNCGITAEGSCQQHHNTALCYCIRSQACSALTTFNQSAAVHNALPEPQGSMRLTTDTANASLSKLGSSAAASQYRCQVSRAGHRPDQT
jgi:hypothetical protein